MKVLMNNSGAVGPGGQPLYEGGVYELPDEFATELIVQGRAVATGSGDRDLIAQGRAIATDLPLSPEGWTPPTPAA